MKVSLNWLKEYVAITLPATEIAEKLTMAGIEVKVMQVIGGSWDNIVIGRIIAINPHPNADRLTLPTLDLGTEQATVVCGAPNLRVGDKIAFARVGAQLIDEHSGQLSRLKSARIRGVVSSGMVCSEKELGISDKHEGIMVLPDGAPVGTPLVDYLGDVIFNAEVTPNRPDCLSVIGIAREIAALTGQSLHLPDLTDTKATSPVEHEVTVVILAPDLCPRYCASLIKGVKVAESPQWLQQRLIAGGLRPISNIVDVTNYVMLEYGQPLHAFDYERIRGKSIIVRRARDGERIVTLDGVERTLESDTLVIADEERAVAVAGVMGGANSEVTGATTSVLLEAASFKPTSIHYTGQKLRLPSEAGMRFERGIRAELTLPALQRATQLMIQLTGGETARGLVDVYPGRQDTKPIRLSTGEVKRLLGIDLSLGQVTEALALSGVNCQPGGSASEILVTAPYWRSDIRLAVDLIEEVARIIGYDKIPTTMLSQPIPQQNRPPIIGLKQKVRQSLTGYGFQEIITYSLTSSEMLNRLSTEPHSLELTSLRVANPMSAEQEYLRPNLRANLLTSLVTNRRYEDGAMRLFELGRVYQPRGQHLPDEPETLCGLLSGPRLEKSWFGGDELTDFFDAKGVVESLLSRLGVAGSFEPSSDGSFQTTKQVTIIAGGSRVGIVGELHPKVVAAFDLSEPVFLFEIDLATLLPFTLSQKMFQPLPRFPAVIRDLAIVVSTEVAHQKVLDVIRSFPLVEQVLLFDVYLGEQVPAAKKSLAYRITFQSPAYTLTDEEVNRVQQQILDRLASELGASLRS